jgi:tRNA-dihydrouridine synthase A
MVRSMLQPLPSHVDPPGGRLWPRFSVAPMMDWTDRHCRFFLRGFSPRVLLYTEMVTAAAVTRGHRARLLAYSPEEQPLALQLGGSDPVQLAIAARAGAEAGFREINLNCGCPSDRVSAGAFGACLMREPARVADCVAAMVEAAAGVPVTVKTRIGVVIRGEDPDPRLAMLRFDEGDESALHAFVGRLVAAGCAGIIIHARKAVLGGLSPLENRSIPPLRQDVARRLREAFPQLPLALNGGLASIAACEAALAWCDSVMIGRAAYHDPRLLADLQSVLYPADCFDAPSPAAALERMAPYATAELARGERLSSITRHLLGLVAHTAGARDYRRLLSEGVRDPAADASLLWRAAAAVSTLAPARRRA